MPYYIVNKREQPNGDHEVHDTTKGCNRMPETQNQLDLGYHSNCRNAVSKAKETYHQVNGCYYCCEECHTG
jgi:hypothetical protein